MHLNMRFLCRNSKFDIIDAHTIFVYLMADLLQCSSKCLNTLPISLNKLYNGIRAQGIIQLQCIGETTGELILTILAILFIFALAIYFAIFMCGV